MIPSLEGWAIKAKDAPSSYDVRLTPLDTYPMFQCLEVMSNLILDMTVSLSVKFIFKKKCYTKRQAINKFVFKSQHLCLQLKLCLRY